MRNIMQRKPFALKHSEKNNFKIINTFYTTKFKVKFSEIYRKRENYMKCIYTFIK